MDIQQMRERRAAALDERKAMHDRATAAQRCLAAEEERRFDELGDEAARWEREIERENQTLAEQAGLDQVVPRKSFAEKAHAGRSYTTGNRATTFGGSTGDRGGFGSLGEMLVVAARAGNEQRFGRRDPRLDVLNARAQAMREFSGDGGGFVVPIGFSDQMLRASAEQPIDNMPLYSHATRIPMLTNEVRCPVFSDTSHATAPYGIAWRITPEGTENADASVVIENVTLIAHKAMACFEVTNELLADGGPAVQTLLSEAIRGSLLDFVEKMLWKGGQGISGALLSGGAVEVDKKTNQAAGTLITENLSEMWSRLLPGRFDRAIWCAGEGAKDALCRLTLASGTGGAPVGFYGGDRGAVLQPPVTLMGRPVFFTEHLPAVGTSGDICLLDPTLYAVGLRSEVLVESNAYGETFKRDCTEIRAKVRFAGVPMRRTTLTCDDGVTRGWLVKIAARV